MERQQPLSARVLEKHEDFGQPQAVPCAGTSHVRRGWPGMGPHSGGLTLELMTLWVRQLPSQPGDSYGPSLKKKFPQDTVHYFRDQGKAYNPRSPQRSLLALRSGELAWAPHSPGAVSRALRGVGEEVTSHCIRKGRV